MSARRPERNGRGVATHLEARAREPFNITKIQASGNKSAKKKKLTWGIVFRGFLLGHHFDFDVSSSHVGFHILGSDYLARDRLADLNFSFDEVRSERPLVYSEDVTDLSDFFESVATAILGVYPVDPLVATLVSSTFGQSMAGAATDVGERMRLTPQESIAWGFDELSAHALQMMGELAAPMELLLEGRGRSRRA